MLVLNSLFVCGYFAFTCSSVLLALQSHATVVLAVLAIEWASCHVITAIQGEWTWDTHKVPAPIPFLTNTILWAISRFCPVWFARLPNNGRPSAFARTIVFGFLESIVFAWLLAVDSPTREAELLLRWHLCVPAGCLGLAALTGFALLMEPQHRASFWRHESREAYVRWQWSRDGHEPGDLDLSRFKMLKSPKLRYGLRKRCPDAVRGWLREGLPRWRDTPPEWFTREWWDELPGKFREGLQFAPEEEMSA